MRTTLLLAIVLAAGARVAHAQTAADTAAIQATAHDYIDGWWTGDAARMARALHSHLAKRIVMSDSLGLDPATYLGVIALMAAVSAIACSVPAWRAAAVDPSITLRTE